MTTPSRDFLENSALPSLPRIGRDTKILTGKLTHADRARITKAWNRAIKLGLPGLWRIEERRDAKRGFSI